MYVDVKYRCYNCEQLVVIEVPVSEQMRSCDEGCCFCPHRTGDFILDPPSKPAGWREKDNCGCER